MIQKERPGPGSKGLRLNRELLTALVAAAVVLSLVLFMVAQWIRDQAEPWRPFAIAENGEEERRVILLLADRLTYSDLLCGAGPNLSQLLEQEAVALMNVRSGKAGSESGYLSLGTAARAVAGPEGRSAFGRGELIEGEKAEVVFKRCTGNDPAGALFHLQAAALQKKNSTLSYPVTVGLLGEMLKEKGLTAAVWGNADAATPNRSAVLIAMDSGGEVPAGAVGADLLQDAPLFPYGVRTDIDKIAGTVAANIEAASLHLVEFGDSTRLDDYWPQLNPARGEALFKLTMEHLDLLIGKLLPLLDQNSLLLVTAPSLPLNRPTGGDQLTPLLLVTAGGPGPGLLGSASTRRPGLVQNTDLASLIISLLDSRNSAAAFYSVASFRIIPEKKPLTFLELFNNRTALVFDQRPALLKGYIAALVVVLLAALVGLLLKNRSALRPASWLIELLLLIPLVLLLLPGPVRFPLPSLLHSGLLLGGAALLPAVLLHPLANREQLLYWALLGCSIALALLVDTLAGAPLQQLSLFSYDTVGGARYYGIGNEYMGVLIGSALLGTRSLAAFATGPSSLPERGLRSKRVSFLLGGAILLFYGIIIFVLAAPNFGANLGGSLTAAVAFGASWAGLSGLTGPVSGCKKRAAFSVALFLFFTLGLLWLLNIYHPRLLPSHVGLFGEMVRLRGPVGFWETVLRKMRMNLRLVRYSIWSRAFVTLVGLCAVLSFYPVGLWKRLREEQPYLVTGVRAALAGAAAALLTNDSGVVAAATLLLYVVPPALILIMQKNLLRGLDLKKERQD